MSSSALTEAGVLGLDDSLDSAKSDPLSEHTSAGSVSETEASEADTVAPYSRPDLLAELRKIHVLDELIVEENLKIHELRCSQENPNNKLSGSKPLCTEEVSHVNKERKNFQLQKEKEKSKVEKLEKSLDKEGAKKTHKDKAKKVVKCSIMEKARAENEKDQALCDKLLSYSCNRSQRTHSASLDQSKDTCKTENISAEMGPDVDKEATPHEDVPHCQDLIGPEANPINSTPDLKDPSGEVGTQPQQCFYERELVGSGENAAICNPEASLTPELRPDDGAFDPGGKSVLPLVPKPRKDSLPLNNRAECETPHSTELLDPGLSSVAQDLGFVQLDSQNKALDSLPENVTSAMTHNHTLNPNVKEHSNNNNNNHPEKHGVFTSLSEMATKDKKDTSVAPACLPHTDLRPTMEIKTLSNTDELPHQQLAPQLPLDQRLEFDPGGTDQRNKDFPDGAQRFDAMRVSGPGSPGIQAQLNSNMRQVQSISCLCLDIQYIRHKVEISRCQTCNRVFSIMLLLHSHHGGRTGAMVLVDSVPFTQ